jgi:hypothetical protein
MSIEQLFERIATALEKIAQAGIDGMTAPSGAEKEMAKAENDAKAVKAETPVKTEVPAKAEAPADKKKAPSLDDVIAALSGHMKVNGRDAAVALLAKYGAKRASDIPEDKREDFVTAAKG